MASLDLSIVNIAFPALQRSFPHDPRAALAWVITGYSIVFGSLLVTAGRTADRLGSRRMFFAGMGVFSLGSALCGLAPSVLPPRRRPAHPGGRGRLSVARLPELAARRLSERPSLAGGGPLGRGRCVGRRHGTVSRRSGRDDGRLEVGLLHEPPDRRRGLAGRAPDPPEVRAQRRPGHARLPGRAADQLGLGGAGSGDLGGTGLGLVEPGNRRVLRRQRSSSEPGSSTGRRIIPNPCST